MRVFGRSEIVKAKSPVVKLEIPEWDGAVYLRKWTTNERAEFIRPMQEAMGVEEGKPTLTIPPTMMFANINRLVAVTLCDESGKRLFDDSEEDLALIGGMEADALTKIFMKSLEINGLAGDAGVAAELKNSEPTQKSDSSLV